MNAQAVARLNGEHYDGIDNAFELQERREKYVNELLSSSECWPNSAENLQEAVTESSWVRLEALTEALNGGNDAEAGRLLRIVVTGYWRRMAMIKAVNEIN